MYPKKILSILLILILAGVIGMQSAYASPDVIQLDPNTTYQTIVGWEAVAQAGQTECAGFANYKDELFNRAVNELGINRIRLEYKSNGGSAEGSSSSSESGGAAASTPSPNNYSYAEFDNDIETVVLPLQQRLEAEGEHLFVNVTFVNFNQSPYRDHPDAYAQFVLATYQHMQTKYGFVPDAWEVILEPDTKKAGWSGEQIGQAIVAAGDLLKANGFKPAFIAPSTTDMGHALGWFNKMIRVPGVLPYLAELSYHRYIGVSEENLRAIAQAAQQNGLQTAMLEHIGSDYKDLHQDLKVGMNSAWEQFTLAYCSQNDNGGAYYRIDNSDPSHPTLSIGSRTRFLRQYFYYIRSGAVRIGASSDNPAFDPLAFINTDGNYVVVVKADQGGNFSIRGLPAGTYGIQYTTYTKTEDLPDETISAGGILSASIPRTGVITVYARNGKYPAALSTPAVPSDPASETPPTATPAALTDSNPTPATQMSPKPPSALLSEGDSLIKSMKKTMLHPKTGEP